MAQHLEESEQVALMQWAQYQRTPSGPLPWFVIAVPNGTHLAGEPKQRAFQMARLKKAGLRPGAADLFVMLARGGWHGLWIEMKKRRDQFRSEAEASSALSSEQRDFRQHAEIAGYCYAVCYGFDEASARVQSYLEGRDVVVRGDGIQ